MNKSNQRSDLSYAEKMRKMYDTKNLEAIIKRFETAVSWGGAK